MHGVDRDIVNIRGQTRKSGHTRNRATAIMIAVVALLGASVISIPRVEASTTSTTTEVNRWYNVGLQRSPDTAGRNYWVGQALAVNEGSYSDSAYAFHSSTEFFNNRPTWYSRVTALYTSILNRAPDTAGRNYWVSLLQSGATDWNTVLYSFSHSAEASNRYRTLINSDCGAPSTIPSSQIYANATASMDQEAGLQFGLPKDNRFGIHVLNMWIRGTQRQSLTPWIPNPAFPVQRAKIQTDPDSDRGSTRTFSPNDSRGFVVLDYAQGKGWALVHSTTIRVNIEFAPDLTHTTRAFTPKFDYATSDATWFWEDRPTTSIRRLRIHMTAAWGYSSSMPGFVQTIIDGLSIPSVDAQILIPRGTGTVTFQGDSFPNYALFRYDACAGSGSSVLKFDHRHVRTESAWTSMVAQGAWSYDAKYTRSS